MKVLPMPALAQGLPQQCGNNRTYSRIYIGMATTFNNFFEQPLQFCVAAP
jgi:hypothetical protein